MNIPYEARTQTFAKQLRKNMTKEERKLWFSYLRDAPVKWYRQKQLLGYIVDFYCRAAKVVIEIDGGQHYEKQNQVEDLKRTQELEQYGLKVLRFTNLDITRNFTGVYETIEKEIKERLEK